MDSLSWFTTDAKGRTEPSMLGEILIQFELFLFDVCREVREQEGGQSERILLAGRDQGAVIALAMCMLWPERVGGIICQNIQLHEDTFKLLPKHPGVSVPALLLTESAAGEAEKESAQSIARHLKALGVNPTHKVLAIGQEVQAKAAVSAWLAHDARQLTVNSMTA